MKVNLGFFISKFLRWLNRPALRNCLVDKTANIGTGSNCINVIIGRYSYLGKNNSVIDTKIGSFCSIASYCAIGGDGHDVESFSTSPVFFRGKNVFGKNFATLNYPNVRRVNIGNDVWIGEGVFIKAGVTVGDGVIIGAHSVVTRDIPDYSIVAGSPAKLIRMRFSDEKVELLKESKWWEWTEGDLIENCEKLIAIVKD